MSLNPICSVTDFNAALDAISSRIFSVPQQRETISKELKFLQEHLDFLVHHGTEIQITDLAACQMRLAQVKSAFKRGIQPLGSSTALALNNSPQVAAPVQAAPSIFILPAECMVFIFSRAIENQFASITLGTLSLVCKGWLTLTSDDVLWKPVFDRYIGNTAYGIDYSSSQTLRDKIILTNKTLDDFRKTILECIEIDEESKLSTQTSFNKFAKELTKLITENDLSNLGYQEIQAEIITSLSTGKRSDLLSCIKPKDFESIANVLIGSIQSSSNEEESEEYQHKQIKSSEKLQFKNKIEIEFNKLGSKRFLNEYNLTDLINYLINNKDFESVAKLLIFKPKIDADKILANLMCTRINDSPHTANREFIAQLMVKLGYKETSFVMRSMIISEMLIPFSQLKVNGLKISDYVANGNFFLSSLSDSLVLLDITKKCYPLFYSKGTFESLTHSKKETEPLSLDWVGLLSLEWVGLSNNSGSVSFSDEKLQKHIRKGPFSEEDLKELILDLLTKVGLDLDKIYPEINIGTDSLKEGTLLSQFRQLVDTLPFPKPNALSKALAEYDQMQAEKQTEAEKL